MADLDLINQVSALSREEEELNAPIGDRAGSAKRCENRLDAIEIRVDTLR